MSYYIVRENDTPQRIAAGLLGDANSDRWPELVDANPQKKIKFVGDPHLLQPYRTFESLYIGERLAIPSLWWNYGIARLGVGSPGGALSAPTTWNQGWELRSGLITGRYKVQPADMAFHRRAQPFASYWMEGKACGTWGSVSCLNQLNGDTATWWKVGAILQMPVEAQRKAQALGVEILRLSGQLGAVPGDCGPDQTWDKDLQACLDAQIDAGGNVPTPDGGITPASTFTMVPGCDAGYTLTEQGDCVPDCGLGYRMSSMGECLPICSPDQTYDADTGECVGGSTPQPVVTGGTKTVLVKKGGTTKAVAATGGKAAGSKPATLVKATDQGGAPATPFYKTGWGIALAVGAVAAVSGVVVYYTTATTKG
jgi:hypothetical protein